VANVNPGSLFTFDILWPFNGGGTILVLTPFRRQWCLSLWRRQILTLDDHRKNMYKCVEHANQTKWWLYYCRIQNCGTKLVGLTALGLCAILRSIGNIVKDGWKESYRKHFFNPVSCFFCLRSKLFPSTKSGNTPNWNLLGVPGGYHGKNPKDKHSHQDHNRPGCVSTKMDNTHYTAQTSDMGSIISKIYLYLLYLWYSDDNGWWGSSGGTFSTLWMQHNNMIEQWWQ
jgi:hypothetical protein